MTAIANSSYDEYGAFSSASLESGHIHVQEGGYISQITASAGQKVTIDGSADKVTGVAVEESSKGYVADNNGTGAKGDESKGGYAISNLQQLLTFRDGVNNGSLKGITARLAADIDISSEAWQPIGNRANPFYGTFLGAGHTINGLSNKGYYIDDDDVFTTSSTNISGAAYGFFGVVGQGNNSVNIGNFKLHNVNLSNVQNNMCGAVVGADMNAAKVGNEDFSGDITLDSIEVKGTLIKSKDSTAAILGKSYTSGNLTITNCVTDIPVESEGRAAGLVAYINYAKAFNITGNTIKKDVTAVKTAVDKVAIFTFIGKNYVIDNNTTTGMKAYYNGEEQEDYYTLSYAYDENGNATSVTMYNDASKVKFAGKYCGMLGTAYDGAIIGTAEHPYTFTVNNQMDLYNGVIVNNLIALNITNKYVYTHGTVTFNGGHVCRIYQLEENGHVIFNGGDYDLVSEKYDSDTYTVTGGVFFKNPKMVEYIPGRTTETGSSSGQVGTDYYCLRYFLLKEGTTNRYDYIIFSLSDGWDNNSKIVGEYTVTRTGEPGNYSYSAEPLAE